MKKSLIMIISMVLSVNAFAAKAHHHPKHNQTNNTLTAKKKAKAMAPGYCQIEIINQSRERVFVNGTFDDGSPLRTFVVEPSPRMPEYIDLYYYGYCHNDMYLNITTTDNYLIYSNYTTTGTTLHIDSSYFSKANVKAVKK